MRYTIPAQLFKKNRAKIAAQMKEGSVAVIHAADSMPRTGDLFFSYRQDSNLFYLTGIEQEKTILILAPSCADATLREQLFILRADKKLETWEGPKLSLDDARIISGIESVRYVADFDAALAAVLHDFDTVYLPVNENPRYSSEVPTISRRFVTALREQYPLHQLQRLSPLLTTARLVKEPEELALMKQAGAITTRSFIETLPLIKAGLYEYEIEAELTYRFLKQGSRAHAFEPIIASGGNSCFLHYNHNNRVLQNGDVLLLDFGAEYANYASDCSRTVPVSGVFTPRQQAVYEAVLRSMKFAISCMVAGSSIAAYHKQVCAYVEQELIELGLLNAQAVKEQDPKKPLYLQYFMHGTSHFIGLDTHDVGTRDITLQNGMVLSCEPGIYIPAESIGVRLETDICINNASPIDLLQDMPIEVYDIQQLMKRG